MKHLWSKVTRRMAVLRRLRCPGDLFLFLRILAFAAAVPALMRLKLPRLETLLAPKVFAAPPKPARVDQIVNYVDAAIEVGRPLVRPKCLTRGLTLYYFLRKAGLDVGLCFGVEKSGEVLSGHCWLSKGGEPFLESGDPRPQFTTVYYLPQDS